MQALMRELRTRWREMFSDLAAGDDLPPGERLRAEGMMEAVLLTGEASAAEVDAAMDACYREAFGRDLDQDFGAGWRDFHPFPQIPAVARRAPVFPSTPD
jgi:hypothetical protein